jgi:hypothetical protein
LRRSRLNTPCHPSASSGVEVVAACWAWLRVSLPAAVITCLHACLIQSSIACKAALGCGRGHRSHDAKTLDITCGLILIFVWLQDLGHQPHLAEDGGAPHHALGVTRGRHHLRLQQRRKAAGSRHDRRGHPGAQRCCADVLLWCGTCGDCQNMLLCT